MIQGMVAQAAIQAALQMLLSKLDKTGEGGNISDQEDPRKFVDSVIGPEEESSDSVVDALQAIMNDDDSELSDRRIKDLSIEDGQTYITGLLRAKRKLKPKDVKILIKSFKHPDGHATKDIHIWRDDVLNKYADHIKNYSYQYKEEAKKLDPNIDPNTKHIGPMAQDVEQVNPACVITDKATGYKSVDTGRLALMNAGAIAQLARELAEVKNGSAR